MFARERRLWRGARGTGEGEGEGEPPAVRRGTGNVDLDDVALCWSAPEITDDGLYRDKVEIIPCNFKSFDHYLISYRAPLIEETRSDLCSCLELIREAPLSKILSMEVSGKSGSYFMDVDFWDNEAGFSTEAYAARNGDIFILSSMKPEAAEDLNRHGVTYCLAMVTEVSMDDEYQKGFRVKVAKVIGLEEDLNKLKHAIFLNNITTNMWIWKALTFDTHMNYNFRDEDVCGICVKQEGGCLASFTEQLQSVKLNRSQVDAIESVISAVLCRHVDLMKLIWGPPGTEKTKTVSALLWVLACLKCRTLTCAPTNVAVVGVCTRFLQNLKDFNGYSDDNGLPVSLGDVLLFGSRSNMDMTDDLQDVLLDFRVDELGECFSSLSGWKYRIASVLSFFEDCVSRYDMLLVDDDKIDIVCFLDLIKKQFNATSIALERCIMNLWVHLPGSCFSRDIVINISTLLSMLKRFGALLCDVDLTDEGLRRGLGCLSTENSVCPQPISSIEKELDGARSTCLKLLKDLLHSLNLPTGVDKNWVQNYCICNATPLFSTVSSAFRLHHTEIAPLDVLIVDEAAQVRECELVIPLRLHWVKHVVLVGDDCQLSAMVKSKVCKVGFGTSLYGRLVMLKFEKHLLNIQYRMNPCISLFPNAQFYDRKILDGPNVLSPSYSKDYTCLPFGSYTFINVTDGREDKEGAGNSRRNMVEVAVVLHLIHTIFKSWKRTGQGLSIGVVSPYNAQVDAIKTRLGKKYDTSDGFHVRVKSIDGFQGEEDDIIILSTVRSNVRGVVGFLADNQRTNVALTRARHCLWIVGNAHTLYKSETEWTDLVADAENRKCVFSATNDATICKLALQVKQELDELDDLLDADSAVFSNTRWKVVLGDEFRKSFTKLKSSQLRREVLQKLIRLGGGWRTTVNNLDIPGVYHLTKVYKVRDLYLVWSTDVEKTEGRYIQIIRIWDLLSQQNLARTIQRLENLFSMYTDDCLDHCRRVQRQGNLEVPVVWDVEHDTICYNKDCKDDAREEVIVKSPSNEPKLPHTKIVVPRKVPSEKDEEVKLPHGQSRSKIFINNGNSTIPFEVKLNEPSKYMMENYMKRLGGRCLDFYFDYNGKAINSSQTLASYGILNGCKINVNHRIRGGGKSSFQEHINARKHKFTAIRKLPDGNLSLQLTAEGCRFLFSIIACFTSTWSNGKSYDGKFKWDINFKIDEDGNVQIAVKAISGLQRTSMKNDIEPLLEKLDEIFSSRDCRLRNNRPPYFDHLRSYLNRMESGVLTNVDKLILTSSTAAMESHERLILGIALRRKYKGLSRKEKAKWDAAIVAALAGLEWDGGILKLPVFVDISAAADKRNSSYELTKHVYFRLIRDYGAHCLEHRWSDNPSGKPSDEQIEKFADDDSLELMIPLHIKDFLARLIEQLIIAKIDITRELSSAVVRLSKCPIKELVPPVEPEPVSVDYIPPWMKNMSKAGVDKMEQAMSRTYIGGSSQNAGTSESQQPNSLNKGKSPLTDGISFREQRGNSFPAEPQQTRTRTISGAPPITVQRSAGGRGTQPNAWGLARGAANTGGRGTQPNAWGLARGAANTGGRGTQPNAWGLAPGAAQTLGESSNADEKKRGKGKINWTTYEIEYS